MRPQDVVILLKVLASDDAHWRHLDIAQALDMSQSEITTSLDRSRRAGLIDEKKRKVFTSALLEFLIHGLRYVYPAEPGPLVRGVPTAHSAPPLASTIVADVSDTYVWPHVEGTVRGQAIMPLYPTVPQAAQKDPQLHELLALVDALRVGRAREQRLAADEMKRRISGK